MSKKFKIAALALLACLVGCGGQSKGEAPQAQLSNAAADSIDQANICETQDFGLAKDCKPGQKIVFLPRSFGNEQLPILFAAANCDLRYAVVSSKGAVTCIFSPIKIPAQQSAAPAAEPQASAASR